MSSLLENIGILAITFVIIYGYKKLVEYHDLKQAACAEDEDEEVRQAAQTFRVIPFSGENGRLSK